TLIESFFFVDDTDENKRAKVVEWLVNDDGVQKNYAARLLGLPADRIHGVQLVDVGAGKPRVLVVVVDASASVAPKQIKGLAFTPDGKHLAIEVHDLIGRVDNLVTDKWVTGGDVKNITNDRVLRLKIKGQVPGGGNDS